MRTAVLLSRITPLLVAVGLLGAAPAAADTKIGFVDMRRAVREVDEGKAASANLKKEFDGKQKQLDDRKAEFDKLRGEFEKQSGVMSDEARKTKQGELERKGAELQGFFMQQQRELSDREGEIMRGIVEKMQVVVREIAEAEGVGAVVTSEALVYAQPSLDLTNELVRKYNARYKPGAAGAKKADAADAKKGPAKPPKKEGQ